ncbi:MarR family winged helix-turn-helix transcriptional regulator [Eubacteriaceae bacterium ES2]|nr:MarR family winged helix-turn-helix transcriptional regulator [Eubacteriaceae bacterium ES2]
MQSEDILSFIKLNTRIFRSTQVYLDRLLKKYDLSSGTYPYLFRLMHHDGISQNQLSQELGHDKAMTARTICRLVELGYLRREKDLANHRANKIYLTVKARQVIPDVKSDLFGLAAIITADLTEEEKNITMRSLIKINDKLQTVTHHKEDL